MMKVFGSFRLDTVSHCLWRGDKRAPLTPKAFDVLRYLVDHTDRLVTQEELLDALWPETYVNPEGIRKYILEIRKVLGDRSDQPAFIETLPKRGYQFVAPVTEERKEAAPDLLPPLANNIVGRQAGLARLDTCLQRTLGGQRQVVFVTGEAGIGKTTLVDAFQQQVHGRQKLRIARGQCIEGFGGIEAYYPMLEALGSLLRDGGDNSFTEILASRAPTWLIQFPALVKSEQRESLQREILGSTRERMVREICEALAVVTEETPLMVILEDLHWVDPSTLDLISALARRRESARLLLIGTYRPVDVVLSQSPLKTLKQDLLVRNLCHEIAIECLEESDVADYLGTMFQSDSIPAGFSSTIHQNSGGNPLFMAAIVQDMLNKGLIAEDQGRLVLTAPVEEIYPGIPETLQQMLETQLEQLDPEDQRILQCGSVAGERFSVWAVSAMAELSPASIEEHLDRLASRRRFIRSAGMHPASDKSPSAHYEFRHSLYRQALYRSLSGLNRSRSHLSLGEQLMPICSAGKPELASEIALHFEAGRDHERAARCLLIAAENAAKRFSYRDSVGVLQHALEFTAALAPDTQLELELQILRQTGNAQYALGEMSDSAVSYQALADLAARAGVKTSQISGLVHLAVPLWYIDPVRGAEVCRQALEMSREIDDPVLAARTQLTAASLRLLYDEWREEDAGLCAQAQETIRSAAGSNTPIEVFYVYVLAMQGNYKEAHRQADALLNTTTNPTAHVLALGAKGFMDLGSGRFGGLLRTIQKEQELAEKNEADPWMWIFGEAWLRALCWDFDGVRRLSKVTMRSDAEPHAAWTRTVGRVSAGYAELVQGNFEKAFQYFAEVRDFQTTPKFFLHWHWRMHAELGATETRLAAGDLQNARREADGYLASALSAADPTMRALAWEIKSRVARAQKDFACARQCIENAFATLSKFDLPTVEWHVHRTAWDLYRDEGNDELAGRHRARAQDLIMTIANTFEPDEPLRQSFLAAPPIKRVFEEAESAYDCAAGS